jgi:hypothetical protein
MLFKIKKTGKIWLGQKFWTSFGRCRYCLGQSLKPGSAQPGSSSGSYLCHRTTPPLLAHVFALRSLEARGLAPVCPLGATAAPAPYWQGGHRAGGPATGISSPMGSPITNMPSLRAPIQVPVAAGDPSQSRACCAWLGSACELSESYLRARPATAPVNWVNRPVLKFV